MDLQSEPRSYLRSWSSGCWCKGGWGGAKLPMTRVGSEVGQGAYEISSHSSPDVLLWGKGEVSGPELYALAVGRCPAQSTVDLLRRGFACNSTDGTW